VSVALFLGRSLRGIIVPLFFALHCSSKSPSSDLMKVKRCSVSRAMLVSEHPSWCWGMGGGGGSCRQGWVQRPFGQRKRDLRTVKCVM